MELHEWQAKEILKKYSIPVPRFHVVSQFDEARSYVRNSSINEAVIKVQVHAGGRGKAGGVKVAKSQDEIFKVCQALLGMKIVNKQTGPQGVIAEKIMITDCIHIHKEYYFGIVVDRKQGTVCVIVSPEGGMEIEEIAAKSPEKLLVVPMKEGRQLRKYQLLHIAKFLGWSDSIAHQGIAIINGAIQAFFDSDALLLEVNPLVLTQTGELYALDAKMSIDDNALYRQKELASMYDPAQVSSLEVEAKKFDLAYVALDGIIGCMVNGAGLAMATMDLIRFWGQEPANFLDVGGGASEDKVKQGFKILLSDPKVEAILVNIFGGIMNCEVIANALCSSAKDMSIPVPVVVRMEGTNVQKARKILEDSKLHIITADSLDDAAQKVVMCVTNGKR